MWLSVVSELTERFSYLLVFCRAGQKLSAFHRTQGFTTIFKRPPIQFRAVHHRTARLVKIHFSITPECIVQSIENGKKLRSYITVIMCVRVCACVRVYAHARVREIFDLAAVS